MLRRAAAEAFIVVLAVAAVSTVMYLVQGGVGAGAGRFDRVIGLLALPWILIPWPEAMWVSDYVMLVLLPLGLNLLVVLLVWRLVARRR